jgi:cell division protein FtsQ
MKPKKSTTSFLYVAILTILLALGIALFLRSSYFAVEKIQIKGLEQIPENEIARLASGVIGQNLILLDQVWLNQNVMLHPLVEKAEIKRDLPGTLVIQITERTPVALVTVNQGVVEVDGQGIFLRRREGWPDRSYPVINGITIPDTAGPGQKLELPGLQAALVLLGQAPSELIPLIGEVYVNPIQQMTLYLTDGVEVRLGIAKEWTTKLRALYELLNDEGYKSFQNGVRYIDFTAAKPVIGR